MLVFRKLLNLKKRFWQATCHNSDCTSLFWQIGVVGLPCRELLSRKLLRNRCYELNLNSEFIRNPSRSEQ
jgi:hypothetical protein